MIERTDLVRGYKEAFRRATEQRKKQQGDRMAYTKNEELKRDLASIRPIQGWLSVDNRIGRCAHVTY